MYIVCRLRLWYQVYRCILGVVTIQLCRDQRHFYIHNEECQVGPLKIEDSVGFFMET